MLTIYQETCDNTIETTLREKGPLNYLAID